MSKSKRETHSGRDGRESSGWDDNESPEVDNVNINFYGSRRRRVGGLGPTTSRQSATGSVFSPPADLPVPVEKKDLPRHAKGPRPPLADATNKQPQQRSSAASAKAKAKEEEEEEEETPLADATSKPQRRSSVAAKAKAKTKTKIKVKVKAKAKEDKEEEDEDDEEIEEESTRPAPLVPKGMTFVPIHTFVKAKAPK